MVEMKKEKNERKVYIGNPNFSEILPLSVMTDTLEIIGELSNYFKMSKNSEKRKRMRTYSPEFDGNPDINLMKYKYSLVAAI